MSCNIQEDDSFKRMVLGSLSDDLIRAKQQLSMVTPQHTACLEVFLDSHTLVRWVQDQLRSKTLANTVVQQHGPTPRSNTTVQHHDPTPLSISAIMVGHSAIMVELGIQRGLNLS